jgi:hypothetical protein
VRADDDLVDHHRLGVWPRRHAASAGSCRAREIVERADRGAQGSQHQDAGPDLVDGDIAAGQKAFHRLARRVAAVQRRGAEAGHQFGFEQDLDVGLARQGHQRLLHRACRYSEGYGRLGGDRGLRRRCKQRDDGR